MKLGRVALLLPLSLLAIAVFGIPAVLSGLLDRTGQWPRRIAGAWGRALLRLLGVRVVVRGVENLPPGPALYAANHGSALDIPIVFGHLPVDFRIIHKRSLYLWPILGQFLYLGGHIGVDRSNPFKAKRSLQQVADRILGGTSVTVFPEGTRSRAENLKPFKRGSFLLAIQAGVPVVPVSLGGVKPLVPQGILSVLPGTVTLTIHPPVPTAGRSAEEATLLADEIRATVAAACGGA